MALVSGIIAGIGLATSVIGGIAEAKARKQHLRQQSLLAQRQGTEVLARNMENSIQLRRSADQHTGKQRVQLAGSGRSGDVSSRAMEERTYRLVEEQINRNTRAAEWEADMILVNAHSKAEAGEALGDAGEIMAWGKTISGMANIYDNLPGDLFKGGSFPDFFGDGSMKDTVNSLGDDAVDALKDFSHHISGAVINTFDLSGHARNTGFSLLDDSIDVNNDDRFNFNLEAEMESILNPAPNVGL